MDTQASSDSGTLTQMIKNRRKELLQLGKLICYQKQVGHRRKGRMLLSELHVFIDIHTADSIPLPCIRQLLLSAGKLSFYCTHTAHQNALIQIRNNTRGMRQLCQSIGHCPPLEINQQKADILTGKRNSQ